MSNLKKQKKHLQILIVYRLSYSRIEEKTLKMMRANLKNSHFILIRREKKILCICQLCMGLSLGHKASSLTQVKLI